MLSTMDERLAIRHAERSEREVLVELQRRASLANAGDREALLANPDAIDLPLAQLDAGYVFVAQRGASLAGFAAVLPRADGDVELDGLFVEPHLWKTGVGKALVCRCVRYAREHGARALHVVGNPHAARFYTACGFASAGTAETRFGPALSMKRAV
jgi:N-acetylglutamate synthase-like GNAT family acetyltransferase